MLVTGRPVPVASMYDTIVVPGDGSDPANRAVEHGLELAERFHRVTSTAVSTTAAVVAGVSMPARRTPAT